MVYEEVLGMENQVKFEGQIECISILRVIGALGICSIPYWNIQQLYCYTAGWCQLVLLHQCFPDDVHNSEGDPQALHFKEIDSDCSTLLDHDSVYFCCNAIYSVNFNGGGVHPNSLNRYFSYHMFVTL